MQIYISENKEFYYQGQVLNCFDSLGNYLGQERINKFKTHKRRKNKNEIYLCVNMQSLEYKSKNYTIDVANLKYYKKSFN